MTSVSDVMVYLCGAYPHPQELSNARLTKLVYLGDWESARRRGRQITSIGWIFNHYGPWVPDVLDTAKVDSRFIVETVQNAYGSTKTLIRLKDPATPPVAVDDDEGAVLDYVIAQTETLYFGQFIDFVYQTYPVKASTRYENLDLVGIAAKERMEAGPPDSMTGKRGQVDGFNVEDSADLRQAIHDAVAAQLGKEPIGDAADHFTGLLEQPTIESIESQYQVRVVGAAATDALAVDVDVECEVEGFMRKLNYFAQNDHGLAADIHVRDENWNDDQMWVSVNAVITFLLSVRRSERDPDDRSSPFDAALLGMRVA